MVRRIQCVAFLLAGVLSGTVIASCDRLPTRAEAPATLPAATGITLQTVVEGLNHPWGMAWLPGGDVLITERSGQLRWVRGGKLQAKAIAGIPDDLFASGQGGLLDVAVHPKFEQDSRDAKGSPDLDSPDLDSQDLSEPKSELESELESGLRPQLNQWVYFSYSAGDRSSNRTQVARARFDGTALKDWQVIFRVSRDKSGTQHFGSRLAWLSDGTLLVSIGDGGNPPVSLDGDVIRKQAQNLSNALGSVIRINDDGSIPVDNPFLDSSQDRAQAEPALWSYGHRNIQGLAVDSTTGQVWATEHGARGGDELNRIEPGENYGWPEVSYSKEYTAPRMVAPVTTRVDVPHPLIEWTPSIAPSGLAVYRGDRYPGWQGNLFAGALVDQEVRRIAIDDAGQAREVEAIALGQRVRDVEQGPDGFLYVLTDDDNGRLVRLVPLQ